MKTLITIEIDHAKPVPDLAEKAVQRTYTVDGVEDVRIVGEASSVDLIDLPLIVFPEGEKA